MRQFKMLDNTVKPCLLFWKSKERLIEVDWETEFIAALVDLKNKLFFFSRVIDIGSKQIPVIKVFFLSFDQSSS